MRVLLLMLLSTLAYGQPWSSLLPSGRGIDWSLAGAGTIPSGSWTQSGSTITAAACSNGASDCTSTIQTALNACGTNHYVLLGSGTFTLSSSSGLSIPSNCVLRGGGAGSTTISLQSSTERMYGILFGPSDYITNTPSNSGSSTAISSGATAGSTSIVVASTTGMAVGRLMTVTQDDVSPYMSQQGYTPVSPPNAACTWCNQGWAWGDSGQTVKITGISGTTVTFTPPLYMDYSPNNPRVMPWSDTPTTNAGLENVKVSVPSSQAGIGTNIMFSVADHCWVSGIESDWTGNATADAGDHIMMLMSAFNTVQNSYFHDAYAHEGRNTHEPGTIHLVRKASANLIVNNIVWRSHSSYLIQHGASGNVFAYNFTTGDYHLSGVIYWQIEDSVPSHGAHPMYNLFEGNVDDHAEQDSTWGTSSHMTFFRNWHTGSRVYRPPYAVRGTIDSSSPGTTACGGTPSAPCWEEGNQTGFAVDVINYYTSQIGDIVGSAHLVGQSGVINALINPASTSGVTGECYRIGYSDDRVIPTGTTLLSVTSTFQHGVNNCITNAITWDGSTTHTLPDSFFLSSKPSWWGNTIPYPAIGPDITGGNVTDTVANGHVNKIPAMTCFETTTSNGTTNTSTFDPTSCYATASPTAPTVTTTTASGITMTTASSGGNVTSDGGDTVTARGVCYGTSVNPTTPCTSDGTGTGTFTSSLSSLSASTLYHYRAFATNSVGTSYGTDLTFTTSSPSTGSAAVVLNGNVRITGKKQ